MKKKNNTIKKKKYEYTKILTFCTGFIFIFSIISIIILSVLSIDTSSYSSQLIITTGGVFGVNIAYYLNKSKIENLSKAKVRFLLMKLKLELKLKNVLDENSYENVVNEINKMNDLMEGKIDNNLTESIQKDINIDSL